MFPCMGFVSLSSCAWSHRSNGMFHSMTDISPSKRAMQARVASLHASPTLLSCEVAEPVVV